MATRTRKPKTSTSPVRRKPIKKRKYSRAGCDECKRRKMKCDEGKPHCYNCSRLHKVCVYRPRGSFGVEDHKSSTSKRVDQATEMVERTGFLPVKHYLPSANGGYLNRFVLDTKSASQASGAATSMAPKFPAMAPLQKITIRQPESPCNFPSGSPLEAVDIKRTSMDHDYTGLSPSNLVPGIENKIIKSPSDSNIRPSFTNAISDILTPSDTNDYVISQHGVLDLKNLFDEASVLVNDMNDLVSFDFLGNMDEALSHPLFDRHPKSVIDGSVSNAKSPASEIKAISDTFEKHDFQIDEFSHRFINNQNNGQYMGEYDVSTPQIANSKNLQESNSEPNSVLIEKLIHQHNLTNPHTKYLRFLNDRVMSMNYFPFASSIENNEVVTILLNYANNCPYLLSAMLSMSATVQYNITGKQVHDASRQKYISVCLKALSKAFADSSSSKADQLLNDIERLLLTVLVLTSNFSSITSNAAKDNILNSWKTHLRGAKDLLVNYSHTTKSHHHRASISGGLALAKSWFFAIEALAGFTTTLGGTLSRNKQKSLDKEESMVNNQTDEDATDHDNSVFSDTGYFSKEENPEYHDALRSIGLLVSNNHPESTEFHLFLGFTMEIVLLIEEFTKALDVLRANDLRYQFTAQKIAKLMEPICKAQEATIVPKVNMPTYEIPSTSPAHPDFSKFDPTRIELPESAYCKYVTHTDEVIYYAYLDVSQRCHVDSIYLRILVLPGFFKLPREHPLVKDLIEKIMKCLFFIISKDSPDFEMRKDKVIAETDHYFVSADMFDTRAFMIQSPFRLIVKLVQDRDFLERIETFYKGLVKLGNGSALSALDDLEKRRRFLQNKDEAEPDEDPADTLLDYSDIVPFV